MAIDMISLVTTCSAIPKVLELHLSSHCYTLVLLLSRTHLEFDIFHVCCSNVHIEHRTIAKVASTETYVGYFCGIFLGTTVIIHCSDQAVCNDHSTLFCWSL